MIEPHINFLHNDGVFKIILHFYNILQTHDGQLMRKHNTLYQISIIAFSNSAWFTFLTNLDSIFLWNICVKLVDLFHIIIKA